MSGSQHIGRSSGASGPSGSTSMALEGRETTLPTPGAEGDDVKAIGDLYGRQWVRDLAYEILSQANRVTVENQESDAFDDDPIVSVVDGADGTYYYYIDLRGFVDLNLDPILNDGSGTCTMTIEAAQSNGNTAKESLAYTDVSNEAYGSASWTAGTAEPLLDTDQYFKRWCWARIKIVAVTGAVDDADWTILKRKNRV